MRYLLPLILLLPLLAIATPQAPSAAASRPNIVIVMTDDMRVDDLSDMPQTASLIADRGATLSAFIAPTSVCCPARASLLTGQYTHNHGVIRTNGDRWGFAAVVREKMEVSTLATWLDDAGYQTGLFGKYFNGYPDRAGLTVSYVPPGWDRWIAFAGELTGDAYYYDYTLSIDGRRVTKGSRDHHYSTDLLAKRSRAFMRSAVAADEPFFALITPFAPHGPAIAARRHAGMFRGRRAPRTPAFDEADVSDKPPYIRGLPRFSDADRMEIDQLYRSRLRSLQAVDDLVADVVADLDAAGVLDQTYIVVTSDQGYHLGEHRIPKGKLTPYEEASRTPLLIRGPNIPAGSVVSDLTAMIDLAPTTAAWAGVTPPAFVDGRSLDALLRGDAPPAWRDALLLEAFGTSPGKTYEGVRTAEMVYVVRNNGFVELYDLVVDPWQLTNRAGAGDPREATLAARLARLRGCSGAACRAADVG